MTQEIRSLFETYPATVTILGDYTGKTLTDFEAGLGTFNTPGAFQAPDVLTLNGTASATLTLRVGETGVDPVAGDYFLWGRYKDSPNETLTRRFQILRVITTGGTPIDPAIDYVQEPVGETPGKVATVGADGHTVEWDTPAAGGVSSFQTRTGAVSLTKADVTGTGLAAADVGAATTAAVAAEVTRATTAEGANTTAITSEASTARAAEALKLAKASNLADLASAATARTNLGLGNVDNTSDVNKPVSTAQATANTAATAAAQATSLQKASNLSDLANAGTARTNLALGGAATLNVGTTTGTVAAGDDSRFGSGGADTVTTVAAAGASRTLTLPTSLLGTWDITLTATACTVTLAGATAGRAATMTLLLRQDSTGSRTVTWPSSVLWATGAAPILSTTPTYTDIVTLLSTDGGTTWYGALNGSSYQPPAVPAAPTGLAASPGDTTASLSWSAVLGASPAVTGYKVYRSTTSGAETLLATIGNVTTYNDTGLTNNTTYYYKVKATNAVGDSALSSEASALPVPGNALPTTTPAPSQWFKADAITGLSDGAAVASWVDSSANGQAAAQATGSKQPIYKTGIANTLPVLRFNGTAHFLTTARPIPNDNLTVFVVARPAVSGASLGLFAPVQASAPVIQVNASNKLEMDQQNATVRATSAASVSTSVFSLMTMVASANTPFDQAILNGVSVAATNRAAIGTGPSVSNIGALGTVVGTPVSLFNGDIAEVLVYEGVLSTTDRNAVKTYLATKYGITVS